MKPYKKAAAVWALWWALGLSAGYIIGPLLAWFVFGGGNISGRLAMKVVSGIALFPVIFVGFWVWRIISKKDSMTDTSIQRVEPSKTELVSKREYPASEKATPSNSTTVKQDKAELGKSVDRYVSELKGRGIVHVQDFSYSGSLPKAEVKSLDKSLSIDEAFYEKAFKEMESGDRKVGLWAKVFAEAQGNETLAKANYLKIRSGQLANEHKQVLLEEERRRQGYVDGTVMDTNTNLMWAAEVSDKNLNWYEAKRYCQNYRGGSYTNWRMPTKNDR